MCKDMTQLPFSGGMMEQPIEFYDCFAIIKNEVSEFQYLQQEQERNRVEREILMRKLEADVGSRSH